MEKFAERLLETRTERGFTQCKLANLLSVNQRTVSNWEHNLNEPDFSMLVKIAKSLDVTTDYLLGLQDF